MCQLCTDDKAAEQKRLRALAEQLRDMANYLEHLSAGTEKPHTKAAQDYGIKARSIVRSLVEDYV